MLSLSVAAPSSSSSPSSLLPPPPLLLLLLCAFGNICILLCLQTIGTFVENTHHHLTWAFPHSGPLVTSESGEPPDNKFLSLAAAYSGRRRSLRQDSKLQSELSQMTAGLVTPTRRDSMQVAALQTRTVDEIVGKLHLESNIYDQADILTYLFNS